MRYHGQALGRELIKEGLVPTGCRNVQLSIPATGVITLHYDVDVTDETLPKIIAALMATYDRKRDGE